MEIGLTSKRVNVTINADTFITMRLSKRTVSKTASTPACKREAVIVPVETVTSVKRTRFTCPKRPYWLWCSPSLLHDVYRGSVPEAKRLGLEAVYLSPRSAEVKTEWSYTHCYSVPLWRGQ